MVGAEQVFVGGGLKMGRRWRGRILVDNERPVGRGGQRAPRSPRFGPLLLRWRSPQYHLFFLCLGHLLRFLGSRSLSDSLSKGRFWMESKGATFQTPSDSDATMADKSTALETHPILAFVFYFFPRKNSKLRYDSRNLCILLRKLLPIRIVLAFIHTFSHILNLIRCIFYPTIRLYTSPNMQVSYKYLIKKVNSTIF